MGAPSRVASIAAPPQRDKTVFQEPQRRASEGALQCRRARHIANQPVDQLVRALVHRAGWRNTHIPMAQPPGPILQAGLSARREHFDAAGPEWQCFQCRRGDFASLEDGQFGDLAQIGKIGFHAPYRALLQG